ncbi:ribonuclease Z [Cryomorpha ignava]|uniref:Ribonuclease Z n=1 Tax=Cryomorpha ignava TaxID=101383 RepID=A0A7K3WLM4_9FLAO|nr:ribonuclease Z [Cryomorpha ignava]NEN22547.1 ribonuclease Z [Cryomorpha ignava]
MKFEVTILGCGSATPTLRHWPTSQLVNHDEHYFLFDCGEGAQLQLRRYNIKFQQINHLFITHLHGDHCLGLPGLLSTMHLLGRTKDLNIYANAALQEAIEIQLRVSYSRLRFQLKWHPLSYDEPQIIMENAKLQVMSFPLNHRVPCCGFRISEKPKPRNMIPQMIEKYTIPFVRIRQIKAGADYILEDGTVIPNADLTLDPAEPKSYAFCTDTAFAEKTIDAVQGVDLLYHEATFLEKDRQRAYDTFHSTASDAARVANMAGVGKLILGHFSARYHDLNPFLEEAESVFKPVVLANEGLCFKV